MAQKQKEQKEKRKRSQVKYREHNGTSSEPQYSDYESSEFEPQSEYEEREHAREYPSAFESEEERVRYKGGRRYESPYREYRSSEYGEIPTEEYERGRAYEGEHGYGEREDLERAPFSTKAQYEAERAGYERGYEAALREHSTRERYEENYPQAREFGRYRTQAGYTPETGWNSEKERRNGYAETSPRRRNRERSWEKQGKFGGRRTTQQQEQEF